MSTWQAALQLWIIRVPSAVMRRAWHSHGARSFTDGACHDLVLFIHYSKSKKPQWRDRQSPHKSKPWTIEADERYKIACTKLSKLQPSVRDFTENSPQQEMILSNEGTRNMSELTNTLCQTLWGFLLFYFYCASFSVCLQRLEWQAWRLASITSLQNW